MIFRLSFLTKHKLRFDYVKLEFVANKTIGYDTKLTTIEAALGRTLYFASTNINFFPIKNNLIDEIWENKLPIPLN